MKCVMVTDAKVKILKWKKEKNFLSHFSIWFEWLLLAYAQKGRIRLRFSPLNQAWIWNREKMGAWRRGLKKVVLLFAHKIVFLPQFSHVSIQDIFFLPSTRPCSLENIRVTFTWQTQFHLWRRLLTLDSSMKSLNIRISVIKTFYFWFP